MIDYVKNMSLQLVANENNSNNIAGAVAEVGVFRGDFAQYINYFFPHKSLYLFDTFKAFDKCDLRVKDYKIN